MRRIVVLGDSVAGRSLLRFAAPLGYPIVCLEQKAATDLGDKSCGSLLTAKTRKLIDWPSGKGRFCRQVDLFFSNSDTAVPLELDEKHALCFSSRPFILDHLDTLIPQGWGELVRYGVRVTGIDFKHRVVHLADRQPVPYQWLVIATGAASRPVNLLAQHLGARWDAGIPSLQYQFPHSPVTPNMRFDTARLGSGYFWAWQGVGDLDIGIIKKGGSGTAGHSQMDHLVREYANRMGITVPDGAVPKSWLIPNRWRGLYHGQGIFTIGDAAGAAYSVSGEGIPQAVLTAKIAAQAIAHPSKARLALLSFLTGKYWREIVSEYPCLLPNGSHYREAAFSWAIRQSGSWQHLAEAIFGL